MYGVRSLGNKEFMAYFKGLGAFFYYLPVVLVERHKIQKARKISVSEIDELLIHASPPKIPKI